MSNYNLGEARGKIILETDYKGLAEGQKALENSQRTAEGAAQSQQQAWGKVGTAATVAGATVAAGFAVAVASATDFEFQMSAIQAVSGATAGEMDLIRDAALRIGKDTAFSASEAAQAMEELVKAGISTEDVLSGAADATVALAAAGGVDLPTAATIAANAMNQFNLGAEDLVGVTDKIAGAANASAIDMGEFAQSMGQVGAVANLAGLSFDDTALAIAAMGNAGIKGSDAGTSLKTMLMNLQPSTEAQADAMRELGLITEDGTNQFYTAEGSLKSLAEISDVLGGALEGMTDAQKQATLTTLFGTDAVRGAAIVANEGAEGFNKLQASMDATSAAEVAATRMDNMKGSVEALGGSVETLMIGIGTFLIPVIRDIVESLIEAVDWFTNLDTGTQQTLVTIGALVGGLLLAVGATIKIVQAVKAAAATFAVIRAAIGGMAALQAGYAAATYGAVGATYAQTAAGKLGVAIFAAQRVAMAAATAAQWLFNAAMSANPIGIIIAAIAALVAGLIWFFTQTELGQAIWANFMKFLQEAWTNIASFFTTVWEGIVSVATTVWQGMMDVIGAVVGWFQTYVWPVIQFVIDLIVGYFQMYYTVVSTVWNAIMTAVGVVVDWFMTHVWPTIMAVVNFLVKLFNYLQSVLVAVWTAIFDFVGSIVSNIVSFLMTVWTEWSNFWTDIWNAVSSFVTEIWNNIVAFITGVVDSVVSWIVAQWTNFYNRFQAIMNQVFAVVNVIWNNIVSFINGIVNNVVNWITNQWNGLIATVQGIFNNVYNAIKGPLDNALNFIGGIKDKVVGFFSGAGDWLVNAGRSIIEGFLRGLENMFGEVRNFFNDLTNMIPETKGPPARDKVLLTDNGKLIMQSLYNGLQSEMGNVEGLLNGMNATIPMTLQSSLERSINLNAMADSAQASSEAPAVAPVVINQTNNNPIAEPASIQTDKALATVGALATLGTV